MIEQRGFGSGRKPGVLSLLAVVLAAGAAGAAPHEHGVARLAVAIDGATVAIELDAPLDGLLGFERAPRTDAERKAAADVLQRLRDGASLFKPDAAAGCSAGVARVEAPVLAPGGQGRGEHADLEASWTFECRQPLAMRSIDVGLFDAFRRLQRIDVQMAGSKGPNRLTLKRPARSIPVAR